MTASDISVPPVQRFDLVLLGANALTAEPACPLIRNAFIGVRGGRIAWLDAEPPQRWEARRTLPLRDHFVTPGFVNVHTHSVLCMVRGVAADLGFAPSYTPGIPKGTALTPEQARALARLGALEALLFGSTMIGDHFVHADVTTEAMADLGLRLAPSWRLHDVDFAKVAHGDWHYDPAIGEATLRAAMDLYDRWQGHSRVRVNLAAHAVDTCSEGFLREVAELSGRLGLRVNMHVGQSRLEVERVKARTGRSSTQVLADVGLLNDRLLGGHCIYMSESDARSFAAAGAHAVHIPKCNAVSGRLAPTPMLVRAGVNVALATDTQDADMVELMRWALATARVQEGGVSLSWQPETVFQMATLNGARALGMDDEIGSLAVGKAADIVVFDARRPHLRPHVDPLGVLVHAAQGRDVRMVFVAGEALVEEGMPTRVDLYTVCEEAEAAARELWTDCGRPY